jgi:hypothetical protein
VDASPGNQFARALAEKDFDAVAALLDPAIEFRGVTPRRFWEADSPEAVIAEVLSIWFKESDEIEALEKLETDAFADRERVGYRFRVRNPEGTFLIEQQLFLAASDGRINWMRLACSGFRPIDEA